MIGYKDNNFKAWVRPKEDIFLGNGYLVPQITYLISKQQEPIDNDKVLKRSFIQGGNYAGWVGFDIEEEFEIVEVVSE